MAGILLWFRPVTKVYGSCCGGMALGRRLNSQEQAKGPVEIAGLGYQAINHWPTIEPLWPWRFFRLSAASSELSRAGPSQQSLSSSRAAVARGTEANGAIQNGWAHCPAS